MGLERKVSAKYAKHHFLKKTNEIFFFIEDTDKGTKKVFLEILKKFFPDKKIAEVFPLGGRKAVYDKCKESKNRNKNEIYIVDGDMFLISGEDTSLYKDIDKLDNLFVLPRYCIENYLIEKNAIQLILDEEESERDIKELVDLLDYDEWIKTNEELFKELYRVYAVSHKMKSGIKTVKFKILDLCRGPGILCENKIQERIDEIKQKLINDYGNEEYEKQVEYVNNKLESFDIYTSYVSGKDHLLPMIFARMRTITKLRGETATYKVRLAKKVFPNDFEGIVEMYEKMIS